MTIDARVLPHATGVVPNQRIVAFGWGSLNPVHWLGGAVSDAAKDGWEAAMVALFSAAMWMLQLVFHVIDAFTTPDLSANGPLGAILPTTAWIGVVLAGILFTVQLALAAFRHDGLTLGKTLIGLAQFGVTWIGFLGFATAVIVACSGLEQGILSATLHVNHWNDWTTGTSWPKKATDVTTATVLGLGVGGLVIPASFTYLLLMLVREAGLLVLAATSPISSAGLLSEVSRTWFWKGMRWFLAAAVMAPLIALVVGMGVQMTTGVLSTTNANGTAGEVGQAVVSATLLAVGALSPIVLFKLLAFVDPNTASGQAMRSSLSANGGLSGLLSGSGAGATGSDAASAQSSDGSGRSEGEAQSDSATSSRFAGAMTAAGGALGSAGGAVMSAGQVVAGVADKAAAFAESALGGAGIGHGGQGEGSGTSGGNGEAGGASGGQSSGGQSQNDGGNETGPSTSGNDQTPEAIPTSAPRNAGVDAAGGGRDGKDGAVGPAGPAGEQGPAGGPGMQPPGAASPASSGPETGKGLSGGMAA